ncbi:MAG: hypothetical protein JNN05_05070 [Candidatus Omnitrophica bacterium]|nr:hypothetical protein [Candidatus Omnitrophota bacterium]
MRMFSPHIFTRLRQNAQALSYSDGSTFLKNIQQPRNPIMKSIPKKSARISWTLLIAGILLINFNPVTYALDTDDEIQSIEEMSQNVDSESKKLGGMKLVADHLKGSFKIDDHIIDVVRDQEVEYGEMFTVFAMAERMPGGVNEDNVTKVIDIQKGRLTQKSWQEVAGVVGVEMDVVTRRARELIAQFLKTVDGRVS